MFHDGLGWSYCLFIICCIQLALLIICKLVSHGVNLFIPGNLFSIKMYFCTTFLRMGVPSSMTCSVLTNSFPASIQRKCFIWSLLLWTRLCDSVVTLCCSIWILWFLDHYFKWILMHLCYQMIGPFHFNEKQIGCFGNHYFSRNGQPFKEKYLREGCGKSFL